MPSQIVINSLDELPAAAKTILESCKEKKVFAFSGEMGSGKTTIIKAMCQQLGVKEKAVSPTFAIVNEYSGEFPVYHIDLYRLKNLSEAVDIGIEEYLASGKYCFIEWPELIEDLLPIDTARVKIEVGTNEDRLVTIDS